MKKIIAILIPLIIITIGIVTNSVGFRLGNVNSGLAVISWTDSAAATSTISYFTPTTATTSIVVNLERIDAVDFNVIAMASTSAGVLVYNYDCSNDNVSFFQPASNASSVTLATSTNLVASNYAYRNISIPTCVAKYLRINYSVGVASSTIWTQVAVRNPLKP